MERGTAIARGDCEENDDSHEMEHTRWRWRNVERRREREKEKEERRGRSERANKTIAKGRERVRRDIRGYN